MSLMKRFALVGFAVLVSVMLGCAKEPPKKTRPITLPRAPSAAPQEEKTTPPSSTKEGAKKEEPSKEEAKKESGKKDEAKKPEPKTDEPKQNS